MKQKLEFLLFYLLWVTVCLELIFSFMAQSTLFVILTGIVMLGTIIGFACVSEGTDETICELLPITLWLMLTSVIISSFRSGNSVMLCFVGVAALCLLHLERRYQYGCGYER